jgi:branched-chain amino acid transport system substrate-binding protein
MKKLILICTALFFFAASPVMAAKTVKLAYIGGFTGWLAFYDGSHLDGAKLAVDEINATGGILGMKVELLQRDTRSEAQEAVVQAQEMIAEGVVGVIAPCDADPDIAVAQLFSSTMTPVISSCSTAPSTAELGGSNLFLSYPADNQMGAVLAQYAVDQGYKTVLTLTSADNVYTELLPEYFVEVFEKLGGKRVGDIKFKMGQPDFSAEVTKIKAMNPQPDVIQTAAFEPDFPIFIKALRAAGVTIPVLEVDGIDSPTTYALGDVVDGIIFTNAGYPTEGSQLAEFNTKFAKAMGRESETLYNANGYNIIYTFKRAIEKAGGGLPGKELTAAINSLDNIPTVFGTITYKDQERVPLVNITLNEIVGGKKTFVKNVMPDPEMIPKAR